MIEGAPVGGKALHSRIGGDHARRWGLRICQVMSAALMVATVAGCGSATSSSSSSSTSRGPATAGTQPPASGWRNIMISASGSGEFDRVTCPATGDCWAIANLDVGGNSTAQIFHFAGGRWSQSVTPSATSLYGITCPSATECWAVGARVPSGSQNAVTLIEHFDGNSWQAVSSPNRATSEESGLSGVGCNSSQSCWAVGEDDTGQIGQFLLLHYDGRSWSTASAPSQQQEQQSGNGAYIECPSSRQCVLLYNYGTSGGESNTEDGAIYNGHSWRSLHVPSGVLIQGASCPSVNDCYAIGGVDFNGPGTTESIYHFNGNAWTSGSQLPATEGVSWSALTCAPGTSDCWAGGGAPVTEGDPTHVVLAHLVGGNWAVPNYPQIVGDLQDIFCGSTSSCVAVGEQLTSSGPSTQAAPPSETTGTPAESSNAAPLVLTLGG